MKLSLIVGVDVSKSTLDIFIRPTGLAMQITNKTSGFKQWFKTLSDQCREQTLVVMEHTGKYSYRFEAFLRTHGIGYCKINALEIKRSAGMIRGKNDKIDAERIADYGWLRRELLKPDKEVPAAIKQLKELLSLRLKMVRDRSGYISRFKEINAAVDGNGQHKIHKQTIRFFTLQITEIETQIKLLITSDSKLDQGCKLLRSIKGIGWVVACYMLSCTENFSRFANARKFNCYAGLAPFKHESGSSIKGRSRVSHLANKQAKSLLNLAAATAIQHDPEMKTYYQKRVAEGKSKMSCLNIIRAKLVARMFAVIKRQTPYQQLIPANLLIQP